MAQDIAVVKKPKPEIMAISALLAIGGVGMIVLWAMQRGQEGHGDLKPIAPGEFMSLPISPALEGSAVTPLLIGQVLAVTRPSVIYQGPGRDTFTYAQIKQNIGPGGQAVTVYGSGVAGVHVGPASEPTVFDLVAEDQPQTPGCPQYGLCMEGWPGTGVSPICGMPPRAGYADVYLQVYQIRDPQDGDGFTSPTCGWGDTPETMRPRVPVIHKVYRKKILFKA